MIVSSGAIAGVAVVALTLVLTPGPNMLYLVSRTLTQGRPAGLVSLGGVALGFVAYVAATALGLATVFTTVPVAYTTLRVAGACYLLYLAWQALRPGANPVFAVRELPRDSPRRLFAMGFVTNLLNPKIAILYVSLLPQFVDPDRGAVAAQVLILGAVQVAIAITLNGLIVLTAGRLAALLATRPAWLRAQRYTMGTVLGLLALRLATDRGPAR